MRFLIALMLIVTCCGPAELQTDSTAMIEDQVEEVEEITPGFLETDCGHDIGEKACDFALINKDGELWRLSDHAGDVVLIDLSAMWCGPCQQAAMSVQDIADSYEDFHYVTILVVDQSNQAVELAEQQQWADLFGINTSPVLQGSRDLLTSSGIPHGYPLQSWPTFILLDSSHKVAFSLRGFSESMLRQAIEDNI
jgi:thiol-disulfide isomerase/thioredoxin